MFPIAWMYYFGTNLDNRFTVAGFWPSAEQSNKIPLDRDELEKEVERLREQRLERRARRMKWEEMIKESREGSGGALGDGGVEGAEG